MTKIWYRDTLLYTYYDFNVIFCKIFAIHTFLGRFGRKIWSSPNWLKFDTGVHCYMLITILTLIFSKFFSFIFFSANLVRKSELLKIDWNFVKGYIAISLLQFLMFIFSKFLSFIFFGLIWSQNFKFSRLTEIWCRGTLLYAYYDFNVYFFKIFVSHMFLSKFSLILWSSPNCLKFGAGVFHYYMVITALMFIFSKVLSYSFGEIWFQNLILSQLTGI